MGKIYHLVNSIKGGCGKTTLSLWLAAYLESVEKQKSCIIDMDLQGSCMVSLIDAVTNAEDILKLEKNYHYLNELVRGYRIKDTNFIEDIQLEGGITFSVIFASPKQEDKTAFYSGARCNYSPLMEYGTFRTGLVRFFENDETMKKRKFSHIIFDLPPNSDGYSDAALESILNPKYSVCEKGDEVNLFMVMTMDTSHLMATVNGIKEIYTESNDRIPDRLFIVFNNNIISGMEESRTEQLYSTKMSIMKNEISKFITQEELRKKIYFLVMNKNADYADVCAQGLGLKNSSCNLNGIPFLKYASFEDEDYKIMYTNEFKKTILGV